MRFFVDDALWDTRVEVGVGLELEDDIQDIDQEEDLLN